MSVEQTVTKTVHFKINGEGLTNLIRQTWSEGRLSVAFELCEDSGAPPETHIDICTGKQKICGVGDLWLEPDDTTKYCRLDITLESTVERLEYKYVKLHTQFANADLRMRYFSLRCDYEGIKYRNPKLEMYPEYTYAKDEVTIKRVGKELAELEPLFSILYPLVGKKMSDVPYHRFTDDEIFEVNLDHPYYLPNLKERNKDKSERYEKGDLFGDITVTGGIPVFPKKAMETETYGGLTKPHELPKITDHIDKIRPIHPIGLDNTYVENAWISRTGDFYGDPRMSLMNVFVHNELANRLAENNIVPDNDGSPERWMEENGWVKISRNEVLFIPKDDIDYSNDQIETIKKYAEYRKLDKITIGYFGKSIKVKDLDSLSYYRK